MTGRSTSTWGRRLRRFGALFGLGLLGILALLADAFRDPAPYEEQAALTGLSLEALLLVTFVQTSALLAVAVVAGLAAAPRVGLRSHVDERVAGEPVPAGSARGLRSALGPALAVGVAVGLFLVLLEQFQPEALAAEDVELSVPLLLASLPQRVLYGGITEELLLRWGLMSVLVLVLWRTLGRRRPAPSAAVGWAAIVLAAVVFGIGHLPAAVATYGELTATLLVFIVGGNAVGGIAFGWLYWRHSLEAAMIAHGGAHVVAVAVWIVLVLIGG